MRLISYEVLLEVLKKHGLDHAYEILERFFYEEPLMFINSDGEVVFVPFDALEIWDYLEALNEKLGKEVEL
jgi:hypothetical protein